MQYVALVTGASSGVGEALAPLLARRGYRVYGMSRRAVTLPGVTALPADVSDAAALQQAIDQLIEETGRLDVVLHCAGIGGAGPVENMPLDRARRIMDTNFWGSWNLCRATLPYLRSSDRGRLVLVGSVAGFMGIPYRAAYCASKAAVKTLVDSLRLEVKTTPLQVTLVAPGDIATNSIATQYRQPAAEMAELYRPAYQKADDGMAANVDHGMTADYVAGAVYKVMDKDKLKPYYVVAAPLQRASVSAVRHLPGRLWERILAKYYS